MGLGALEGMQPGHGPGGNDARVAGGGVLAGRIRAGDAVALGELFDRHAATALAAAGPLAATAGAAEDSVHDAFVTIWRTIGGFDGNDEALASWLFALTRQHAADLPAAARG